MAHARARCAKSNLRKAIPRTNEERWRSVRSLCRVERHVFRGHRSAGHRCLRRGLRPVRPDRPADPTIIQTVPKPDYFFLWLYAVLALLPPSLETVAILLGSVVAIGVLLLLPFLSGEGEKSWRRRPIAVMSIVLIAVAL